jgi:hypothetical protein
MSRGDGDVIRMTNAPEAYDYGYVTSTPLPYRTDRGRCWRRIEIVDTGDDAYYMDYQSGRYRSGMYPVLTEKQFAEWVQEGGHFVMPIEEGE